LQYPQDIKKFTPQHATGKYDEQRKWISVYGRSSEIHGGLWQKSNTPGTDLMVGKPKGRQMHICRSIKFCKTISFLAHKGGFDRLGLLKANS
jgi:hypothetical protein